MTAFGFQKNMVFNWNNSQYKVERVTLEKQVLLEKQSNGHIEVVGYQDLLKAYQQGEVTFVDTQERLLEQKVYSRTISELSGKLKAEVKRRKYYIDNVLALGEPVFTKEYITPLLIAAAQAIEDIAPNYITFYRWYKRFEVAQDVRSLVPGIALRGRKKRNLCPYSQKLLVETVEAAYRRSPQTTVSLIYNDYINKVRLENDKRLPEQAIHIPSERTFRRLIHQFDAYDLIKMKSGKAKADKKFRIVTGKTETKDILERVEIDHTPMDIFIINKQTMLPMGRPTFTAIIDHFSRMLLGYYVSFQNPSTAAVMGALRHAILPKVKNSYEHPIIKINTDWIPYGIPDLLVVDNGLEFHSEALESVAYDLGMRIEFCPKHEPRFKGTVERFLKTLNFTFASQIPGATFAKFHQRDDYDPLKCAILDFEEFQQLLDKWVLDVYSQSYHHTIKTTPYAKWQEGLLRREPKLPMSLERLRSCIGKTEKRSLRKDGIRLKGITYQSGELGDIIRKYNQGIKVRVVYDPEDMGAIQVYAPDTEEPIKVLAMDQAYAKGLTELQNQYIKQSLRERGMKNVDAQALSLAKFELTQAVSKMLESPKLHKNKRGGKLSGVSSNTPKSEILTQVVKRPKSHSKKSTSKKSKQLINTPFLPPQKLPTFNLRKDEK